MARFPHTAAGERAFREAYESEHGPILMAVPCDCGESDCAGFLAALAPAPFAPLVLAEAQACDGTLPEGMRAPPGPLSGGPI